MGKTGPKCRLKRVGKLLSPTKTCRWYSLSYAPAKGCDGLSYVSMCTQFLLLDKFSMGSNHLFCWQSTNRRPKWCVYLYSATFSWHPVTKYISQPLSLATVSLNPLLPRENCEVRWTWVHLTMFMMWPYLTTRNNIAEWIWVWITKLYIAT